jgi:hypothetical protein
MDAPKGNAGSANPVFIFLLEHPFFFDQYFCELFRLVAVEQSFPKSQQVIDDALAVRMLPLGAMVFVRLPR